LTNDLAFIKLKPTSILFGDAGESAS